MENPKEMKTGETTEIKIKVFPLIGTAEQIYPELLKIRKTQTVLEEFINLQAFQQEQPKLIGINHAPASMGILMVGLIICEDK